MSEREKFLSACRNNLGKPYIYGANGPEAFDCSGFVLYGLRQCSTYENIKDMSANNLFRVFMFSQIPVTRTFAGVKEGMLFFYGESIAKITHVMVVNHVWGEGMFTLMGARGGDSKTTTLEAAYEKNRIACVDVQRGDYWKGNLMAISDPFAE